MKIGIGDRVKFNKKFGDFGDDVYIVASEPWNVGSMQLVKLKGRRGAVRVDALESVCDISEDKVKAAMRVLKEYCAARGEDINCCDFCLIGSGNCQDCPEDWLI